MKKKTMFLAGFVLLAVSLSAQNVNEFEIQPNDDGTISLLNYRGTAKVIVIPDTLFNMPVTHLQAGAFKNKGLTSVTLPVALVYIGNEAFRSNQLTEITIPETVEYIGNDAFNDNRFAAVTIPGKVAIIGASAFQSNLLKSVDIPDSVTFIGNSAFNGNLITSITTGDGLAFIGDYAFADNHDSITSIVLGSGVTYIGNSAFSSHTLSSLTIPDSVGYIGNSAFYPYMENSLASITIGSYVMTYRSNSVNPFGGIGNFGTVYANNSQRGGTYIFADGNWRYAP
jgi:hypothetical protein